MKKVTFGLMWLLFILTILYPASTLIAVCFGYAFRLTSVSAFSGIMAFLSVCIIILNLVFKDVNESKLMRVLLSIITPLSLFNVILYTLECQKIFVVISAFVSAGCCCFLTVKYGKPLALKIVALVLSCLMVLPINFFCFIALFFCQNTVVQTVESPSGKYYAQVIDSDQGALGGDTLVHVCEKSGINAIIFKIEKKPQRVYSGDWGEFENMQIYWKNDGCLVINSAEHEIE